MSKTDTVKTGAKYKTLPNIRIGTNTTILKLLPKKETKCFFHKKLSQGGLNSWQMVDIYDDLLTNNYSLND